MSSEIKTRTIRISVAVHEALERLAAKSHRSVNGEIEAAIDHWLSYTDVWGPQAVQSEEKPCKPQL